MKKKDHNAQGHYKSQQDEVGENEVDEVDEVDEFDEVDEVDEQIGKKRAKRTKRAARESKYKGQGVKITVPILKLSAGDTIAVQFTGEIRTLKIGTDDKPPATLYRVIDLDTGEISDLIGSKVLVSTINKTYPDNNINGKKLLLECDQRADKKYLDVLISELE